MDELFNGIKDDEGKEFTQFQINKINFLNEVYDKRRTQESYWSLFRNYFKTIEDSKGKDIYSFSKNEIEALLLSLPTTSIRAKKTAWSLLDQYLEWSIRRDMRNDTNPLREINSNEIYKIGKNVASKKYHTLDDVYKLCDRLEQTFGFTAQEILPIILARYGVIGRELSWMTGLKNEHIDRISYMVNIIEDDKCVTSLPIDEQFLLWVDKAMNTEELEVITNESKRKLTYKDNGYILKSTRSYERLNKQTIYTTINKMFKELGVKRISFTEFLKSRKFDLLFMIKGKNNILTFTDFKVITSLYNPESTETTYITLKEDYVQYIGQDDVISMQSQ